SRREVIAKMLHVIEDAKLMTPARKEMFAGMYFQCGERVADRVSRKEARQIWRDAYAAGVIDRRQLRGGLRYFHLFRFPSFRKSKRLTLERTWPANFFVRRSATYLKTPLHCGE